MKILNNSIFCKLFGPPAERSSTQTQFGSTNNPGRSDVFKYDTGSTSRYDNYFGRGDQEEDDDVYRYPGVIGPPNTAASTTPDTNRNCGGSANCGDGCSYACCTSSARCYAEKGNRVNTKNVGNLNGFKSYFDRAHLALQGLKVQRDSKAFLEWKACQDQRETKVILGLKGPEVPKEIEEKWACLASQALMAFLVCRGPRDSKVYQAWMAVTEQM